MVTVTTRTARARQRTKASAYGYTGGFAQRGKSLTYNFPGFADNAPPMMINIAKQARLYLDTQNSGYFQSRWYEHTDYKTDGYITSLDPAWGTTKLQLFWAWDDTIYPDQWTPHWGRYRFTWTGSGTFADQSTDVTVESNSANDVTFVRGTSPANWWFYLENIDWADPPRDFVIVHEDQQAAFDSGDIFHPTRLEWLRARATEIRWMGALQTNTPYDIAWEDWPTVDEFNYSLTPWPIVIALNNELRADLWAQIPTASTAPTPGALTCDTTFATRLAEYVRDNLHPDLTFFAAFSNEVWNTNFFQTRNELQAQVDASGWSSNDLEEWTAMCNVKLAQAVKAVIPYPRAQWICETAREKNSYSVKMVAAADWQTEDPTGWVDPMTVYDYCAPAYYWASRFVTKTAQASDSWTLTVGSEDLGDGLVYGLTANVGALVSPRINAAPVADLRSGGASDTDSLILKFEDNIRFPYYNGTQTLEVTILGNTATLVESGGSGTWTYTATISGIRALIAAETSISVSINYPKGTYIVPFVEAFFDGETESQLFDRLDAYFSTEGEMDFIAGQLDTTLATFQGLPARLYEGGSHIVHSFGVPSASTDAIVPTIVAYENSSRGAAHYNTALAHWRSVGSGPFMQLQPFEEPSRFGYWAQVVYPGQITARSTALDDWAAANPAWWSDWRKVT